MIFDKYSNSEVKGVLLQMDRLLAKGYDKYYIIKDMKNLQIVQADFNEFFEIASARRKGVEKFKDSSRLFMSLEDLRFATSEIVAEYRAKRLKCGVIVDLCSGVGLQSIAFARTCEKVYAIEIDPRKVEYAKLNALIYGIDNIEFICGDVLDLTIVKKLKDVDVVFCDPERLEAENERKIENISLVNSVVEKYSNVCKNLAIEVPPQLTPEKIDFVCEKEYLSVDNELNRLTLYFGDLKKENVSVVSLPSEERLVSAKKKINVKENYVLKYIYDVDRAVLKAGLVEELCFALGKGVFIFKKLKKNLFLTSDVKISNVFVEGYKVLKEVSSLDVADALKDLNVKDVILRGEIPEKEYWDLRKKFESGLVGSERVYLFMFSDKVLICRKE